MNRWLRRVGLFAAAMLIGGCGGGGGAAAGVGGGGGTTPYFGSISANSATLDDGSHYAQLGLIATQSGTAQITATSPDFDTFLVVEQVDADGSSEVVAEDDDGGGGTNSATSVSVVAGTHYTALVTSATADATALRWAATALLEAEKNMRAVRGHKQLWILQAALGRKVAEKAV